MLSNNDIQEIVKRINNLPTEEKQAALDVLRDTLHSRQQDDEDENSDGSNGDGDSSNSSTEKKDSEDEDEDSSAEKKDSEDEDEDSSAQDSNDSEDSDSDSSDKSSQEEKEKEQKDSQDENSGSDDEDDDEDGGDFESGNGQGSDGVDNEESEESAPKNSAPQADLDLNDDDVHGEGSTLNINAVNIHRAIAIAENALNKMNASGKADPQKVDNLKKSIEKAKKLTNDDIKKMSQPEVDQVIDDLLDQSAKIAKASISKDLDSRIQKIDTELNDKRANILLKQDEMAAQIKNNNAIKAASLSSLELKNGAVGDIEDLKRSLFLTMKDQIKMEPHSVSSWAVPNRKAMMGIPIIAPGELNTVRPAQTVPSLNIYMDQSASWGEYDIDRVKGVLASLKELELKRLIKINMYFFSDNVYSDPRMARRGGSTSAWPLIVQNILVTRAKNVLVVTDSDLYRQANYISSLNATDERIKSSIIPAMVSYDPAFRTAIPLARRLQIIPGAVFWLWRNRRHTSRELLNYLRGQRGNREFVLNG